VSSLTVIASGTLTLPVARNTGPTVVQFANTTAYASYVVVFPTVKNNPATTLTQIAEVKLSQGMNAPNALAMGTARGGQFVGSTFTFGTIGTTFSVNNWPAGQSPDNALDGDVNANFLLFQSTGMGLIASPSGGATAVNRLSFWTAGDAPERDPISYAVYGFNTVVTQTNGTLASGAAIATGSLTLPNTRLAGPTTVSFVNNTAYASYLVVFPAVKNVPASTITQIAEVQFGYVSPYTPPSGTDKTFTVVAGSTRTLTPSDWGFSDSDSPAQTFAAVKIPTLPATGTLQVDGVNATAGQTVAVVPGPAGATWTARLTDANRGWKSIASSADGTKLAAVESGGPIYTSTDSGQNWTARESNRRWQSIASSADGSKLAVVVNGGQIYTSTDSGQNWTARETDRYWIAIASSADGSKLAATLSYGQIYTSSDSGANWTARENTREWGPIASSADGTKLAAGVYFGGQIYTSTDSGLNWTARLTDADRVWQSIASSADGTKLAAVVLGGQIYTSTDSGVNWTLRESNRQWNSIASSADGTKLAAVVGDGQIYTSTDSGVNWTARETNRVWVSIASSADGSKLAAALGYGQIYTSTGPLPAITYTAPAGTGSASFTFQVQDDGPFDNLDLSPNTLTFNHAPDNTAPTEITLSNATLAENNAPGATVGTLSATDANVGDTHTFTLVAGTGDTNNASFAIVGNSLAVVVSADFETKSSYSVRVRATDNGTGNLTFEKAFTITITDVVENTAPLVTTPTSASILATTATLGGNVTADGGAAITERGVVYSLTSANNNPLISGSGVTKVMAAGTTGVFTAPVTGLTASSGYSFKAYAINGVGTTYSSVATFTTAAPPNAAPTNITLSNATLAENNAANATVGTLTATDADSGDTHTFTLVAGTGSTDNAAFTVTGSSLKLNAAADFETKSSYSVRVRATDSGTGNLTFEKAFTITITDVNEAPTAGADSINRPNNTKVAKVFKTTLLANDIDPEVADTLSIAAVGSALPSGSTVALVGNFVVYSAPATNSGNGSFTYTLSDGAGGHSVTGTVTVTEVTPTGSSTGNPNALRIVADGGNFTTIFTGVPGNSYRVQFTTTTTPPYVWQEFSPSAVFTAPANGVFSQTDVNPSNPMRLYRAVSNP
jgi:hypothetical protein